MPPAIARTPTTEQATMTCRLTLSRLAWRSRSCRSRSRAAVFEAWLFRLLMVVFSIKGTRTRRVRGDTSIGTGGAQVLFGSGDSDRARRSTPSQGVHEDLVENDGRTAAGAHRAGRLRLPPHGQRGGHEEERPEGRGGHGPQQLGQGPLAAAQPGGREKADTEVSAQQQPGGLWVGVREQAAE